MKSKKIKQVDSTDKKKHEFLKKLVNHEFFSSSVAFEDFSETLLTKIDLFLCNTDIDEKHQEQLVKILEEVYSEGVVIGLND